MNNREPPRKSNNGGRRRISPALFGVVLICFALPFATVSCQNTRLATVSGIQLVTGGELSGRSAGPEFWAVVAFVAALAGLIMGFFATARSTLGSAVAGGVGVLSLLLLKGRIDGEVARQGGGFLQVDFTGGFWLALLFFAAGAAVNGRYLLQDKGSSVAPLVGQTGKGVRRFCENCGALLATGVRYCDQCGNRVT